MALEWSTASVCGVDPLGMPSRTAHCSNSGCGNRSKQPSMTSLYRPQRYYTQMQCALCKLEIFRSRADLVLGFALMHVPCSHASMLSLQQKPTHVWVCHCKCDSSSRIRTKCQVGRVGGAPRRSLIRPVPPGTPCIIHSSTHERSGRDAAICLDLERTAVIRNSLRFAEDLNVELVDQCH